MAINAANRVLQTAPAVAYPSSFVNIGLRWLIGSDIGFFIGSQIGAHVPVSLGPGWSSTYNEWFRQWLFGIIGSLIGGGVAAFGTPGLIREVYALTGDPDTGDLLASAFEKADNLGIRVSQPRSRLHLLLPLGHRVSSSPDDVLVSRRGVNQATTTC